MNDEGRVQASDRVYLASGLIPFGVDHVASREAFRAIEVNARPDEVFQNANPYVRCKFCNDRTYASCIKNDTTFAPLGEAGRSSSS